MTRSKHATATDKDRPPFRPQQQSRETSGAAWRENVRSSAGYSIYEGRRFKGRVTHTIVRGRYAVRDGMLTDDAVGSGRYISRAY